MVRKSPAEVEIMARAGKVVADMHEAVRDALRPGVTTAELDEVAESVVRRAGATPSFKGYRGFPATLCISLNEEVVHGIPSPSRVVREGDLVKIDAGAIVDGYHGDSAATWVVGDAPAAVVDLVARTRAAMWAGLREARKGNRLTDISAAVEAGALPHGYGVVREYVGHGIGRALHEDPQVPNYGRAGRGPKLVPGLVLAVEPMFNLGVADTRVLDDDWTVVTADGKLSSHWEHTVAVTDDGPRVLTARSDEPEWPLAEPERIPRAEDPWRSDHLVAEPSASAIAPSGGSAYDG
jgi:methionyl aminopeptidase